MHAAAPGAHPVAPFPLPALRFDYAAFAPAVDEATMRHHHLVVHKGYVDALNALLAGRPETAGKTIEELMRGVGRAPGDIREALRDLGGGHADHQFLWKILAPPADRRPSGPLAAAIDATFGSFEGFRARFEAAALGAPGDGWAFLSILPRSGFAMKILVLPGNGSVLCEAEPSPGLVICDLWEHAHAPFGDRAAWLRVWWRLIDWDYVGARFVGVHEGRTHL